MAVCATLLLAGFPHTADCRENSHPILKFYGKYISPADGDRCAMAPSCSAYAGEAFRKHGPLMGWIMTCDRLVRCGRDETRLSPTIKKGNTRLTLDPVSANDFWWYDKPCRP
ncbi:MAG: membrane protein insertion efficiency factor YidD [Desulfobacteraceae bacterium]|nr:membrane protein insertion efficiency factor YidD [Desulfobacteraceae bacterium]